MNMDRHPKNKGICYICEKPIRLWQKFTWDDGTFRIYYHQKCYDKRYSFTKEELDEMRNKIIQYLKHDGPYRNNWINFDKYFNMKDLGNFNCVFLITSQLQILFTSFYKE